MFNLEFDTDNAAFQDGMGPEEIARILRLVSYSVSRGNTGGTLRDTNGNTVGTWSWGSDQSGPTKMYAINAFYVPAPQDGLHSPGIQFPTFYLRSNPLGLGSAEGAELIVRDVLSHMLKEGDVVNVSATEVEV